MLRQARCLRRRRKFAARGRHRLRLGAGRPGPGAAAGDLDWQGLTDDYDRVREHIAAVIPGFADYNQRLRTRDGFALPNAARERRFATASGRAMFAVHPLPPQTLADDQLMLMTLRSHDQFNTTIYGG